MQLVIKSAQIAYPQGLSIRVEGFKGDVGGEAPSQVFIEVYEGKLRVHVWNGGEDPASSTDIERLEPGTAPATTTHEAPCHTR